jgi:RNA polymerase sigma-70 factor, ECF subfamily
LTAVPTDAELVSRAQGGSAAAFERLVERYHERLFRFLITRCATRADAEDALQDTFVKAFRYLDTYNPRWQFSTWLYRIAIRNAANIASRNPMRGAEVDTEVADDAPGLLQECIRESERENLWLTAKRLLPDEMYAAMWFRYAEDMPVKEISKALGRPQAWTRVSLLRARKRLAAELAGDGATGKESKAYG